MKNATKSRTCLYTYNVYVLLFCGHLLLVSLQNHYLTDNLLGNCQQIFGKTKEMGF